MRDTGALWRAIKLNSFKSNILFSGIKMIHYIDSKERKPNLSGYLQTFCTLICSTWQHSNTNSKSMFIKVRNLHLIVNNTCCVILPCQFLSDITFKHLITCSIVSERKAILYIGKRIKWKILNSMNIKVAFFPTQAV